MYAQYVIPVAVVLLAVLLWCIRQNWVWRAMAAKTLLSLLFAATAVVQPGTVGTFRILVTVGLGLCVVGDALLAIPGKRAFVAGLVPFLLGHVAYAAAFLVEGTPSVTFWVGGPMVLLASLLVFRWLRPHMGTMKGPVTAYIVVITVMVLAALQVPRIGSGSVGQWMVLAGALMFFVSDVFVARHRFVAPKFQNRAVGLPLYYTGQFLIAFAVGLAG